MLVAMARVRFLGGGCSWKTRPHGPSFVRAERPARFDDLFVVNAHKHLLVCSFVRKIKSRLHMACVFLAFVLLIFHCCVCVCVCSGRI